MTVKFQLEYVEKKDWAESGITYLKKKLKITNSINNTLTT